MDVHIPILWHDITFFDFALKNDKIVFSALSAFLNFRNETQTQRDEDGEIWKVEAILSRGMEMWNAFDFYSILKEL